MIIKIRKERGEATAAKFKRIGSAVFKFAMADEIDGERLIRENPFNVISEKGIRIKTKKRVTFLTDAEVSTLITFYMNYDNALVPPTHGVTGQGINYVILLMTTGLRKSEALSLKWKMLIGPVEPSLPLILRKVKSHCTDVRYNRVDIKRAKEICKG